MDWKLLHNELSDIQERCERALMFFRKATQSTSTDEQKVLAGKLVEYLEANPVQGITVPTKEERDAIKAEAESIISNSTRVMDA